MKLYLVRWRQRCYFRDEVWDEEVAPRVPRVLAAFADPAEAEAYRQHRESTRALPANRVCPFHCGQSLKLEEVTSLPEPVFLDWLLDAGLTPPPEVATPTGPRRYWVPWWAQNLPHMTEAQQAKVWQAMDRVPFFEVVETELED